MESLRNPPNDFVRLVGENIRNYRIKQGFSLEALGLEVGSTRWDIYRIEKGRNITLTTLRKLSIALDAPTGQLVTVDCLSSKEELEMLINASKANRIGRIQ